MVIDQRVRNVMQMKVAKKTYRPFLMARSLERMVLKSGRSSGASFQHSFITVATQSARHRLSTASRRGLQQNELDQLSQ